MPIVWHIFGFIAYNRYNNKISQKCIFPSNLITLLWKYKKKREKVRKEEKNNKNKIKSKLYKNHL